MNLKDYKQLLASISDLHLKAVQECTQTELLDCLLTHCLKLTGSAYGMAAEISSNTSGGPKIETYAYSEELSQPDKSHCLALLNSRLSLKQSMSEITEDGFLIIPISLQNLLIGLIVVHRNQSTYPEELQNFLTPLFQAAAILLDRNKITKVRSLAEQNQIRSESFLNSIVTNIPNMVFVKEANELRFVLFNRAGEELLGTNASDLIGKNDYDFFPKEQADFFVKKDREVLSSGKLLSIAREEIKTANGIRVLRTKKIPIFDESGKPLYLLGISEDITEWEAMQATLDKTRDQAVAASVAKSEFLANMSHEIRTPMNGILGMVEILESIVLSPVQLEYLGVIRTSGQSLLSIINDILDLSKVEAGKLEIVSEDVNILQLIKDLKLLFASKISEKAISYKTEIDSNITPWIKTDSIRLRQILTNLLGNALKFTPQCGQVRLSLSLSQQSDNEPVIKFSVSDNGIGIAEDKLSCIFEAFTQADISVNRQYGGTGLGLAISARLAKLMGGKIEINSTPGKGSEFNLIIPYKQASLNPGEKSEPENPILKADNSSKQIKILLTEDNEINQKVITHMLERGGYQVTLASSGEQAIELFKEQEFDLIIMDVQLPVMDGITATVKIREMEDSSRSPTPVLALTAHAYGGYREKCLNAGMNDFLSKPISRADLIKKISLLLESPVKN